VYRDCCSFLPNDRAARLSAPRKLSKSNTQASAAVKAELANDTASSVQPVVFESRVEEAGEKMASVAGNVAPTGSTVIVQQEDNVVPLCDGSATDTAAIQIHVQRPSPVREGSGTHRKLFLDGIGVESKDSGRDSMPLVRNEPALPENMSTVSVKKDDLAASSLENISSNVVMKTEEVEMERVRPISGPATVTCTEPPEFDLVRKSRSVTNSLDKEVESADFGIRSRRSVGAICSVTQDGGVHQFAGGVGDSAAKDSVRRIYSSVSFDRQSLKSPGSSFDIDEPADLSSRNVSGQSAAQKANVYGRSRHTSGLETPMSTLDTSSVTSVGEAGTLFSVKNYSTD